MAASKDLRALIVLAGKIDPSLQNAMLKASGESMKLSRNVQHAASGLNRIMEIAKGSFLGVMAADALTEMSYRIWEFGKQSIKLASDLTEVQNVVDVTFGKSAEQINQWSKAALNAYGLSELQAKQYSGTMGAILKSSDIAQKDMIVMSTKLTGLAGDFSSFYNLRHEDAWEKIMSGISGETEPLRALGINMTVANLEAYALSKGITTSYDKMDQASQTLLRYNYLMDKSKDAQGDFARTQGSFANQQRLFNNNLQQASATISKHALPSLTALYQKGNDFISNIDLVAVVDKSTAALNFMGNAIVVVSPLLVGLTGAYAAHKSIVIATTIAQRAQNIASAASNGIIAVQCAWIEYQTFVATGGARAIGVIRAAQWLWNAAMAANPIGVVITAVAGLAAGIYYLVTNFDKVTEAAQKAWNWLKKFIGMDGGKVSISASVADLKMSEYTKFASGGIATQASIFGEAGPEMAIPLRRTQRSFDLLEATNRILGYKPNGGNVVHLTLYVDARGNSNADTIGSRIKDVVIDVVEEIFGEKARVGLG